MGTRTAMHVRIANTASIAQKMVGRVECVSKSSFLYSVAYAVVGVSFIDRFQ
jgi:hypothetical protein